MVGRGVVVGGGGGGHGRDYNITVAKKSATGIRSVNEIVSLERRGAR